jgi:hypothetical protein
VSSFFEAYASKETWKAGRGKCVLRPTNRRDSGHTGSEEPVSLCCSRKCHCKKMQTHFQWSEAILGGSRILRRYVRSVRGFSLYVTVWEAALTRGLEEPICQRTNTNLSTLYLFLTCMRPPDFDTDHTIKTRIR